MTKEMLVQAIDWPTVMAAPRSAGGHQEVMRAIFGSNAEVIAECDEGTYEGSVAFAYSFPCGGYCLITDSYGSCSGCDSWEDASDDAAHNMITSLVSSARFFADLDGLREFIKRMGVEDEGYGGEDYNFKVVGGLSLPIHMGARKFKTAFEVGGLTSQETNDIALPPSADALRKWDQKETR